MASKRRGTPMPSAHRIARAGRDAALIADGFLSSLLACVALVPLTAVAVSTLIVWLGALLLPLTLRLASVFAERSRARVRRWGLAVPQARYLPVANGFSGRLRPLADPRRWTDLAFEALCALPLRCFTFTVSLSWAAGALGGITFPAWGAFLPGNSSGLGTLLFAALGPGSAAADPAWTFWLEAGTNLLLGAILLVSLPAVLHLLARLDAAVTAAALGAPVAAPGTSPAAPAWSPLAWAHITAAYAAVVTVAVGWPLLAVGYGLPVFIAGLFACVQAAALVLAVRLPVLGVALQLGAVLVPAWLADDRDGWPWPWPVMSLIAQTVLVLLVSARRPWPMALFAWAVPAVVSVLPVLLLPRAGGWGNWIVAASVSAGALLLGGTGRVWFANRRALSEERRMSAGLTAQRRELEERNRIARELHDVVAHSMSVISVQANTAKYRFPGLGEDAEREFAAIASSSRQALSEMRGLLSLLRSPDGDGDEGGAPGPVLAPQPGLEDVPALVEATRRAGTRVALTGAPSEDRDPQASERRSAISPTTGLTAYRVVQEALSNAIRHAPGAEIAVRLQLTAATLLVEVVNGPADAGVAAPAAPGAGLGLAGVRERVAVLGGTAETGATGTGGFLVRAELPLG